MADGYRVSWDITIDASEASTPEEAAQVALGIQRDPDSEATCFIVTPFTRAEPGDIPTHEPEVMVDLDPLV